MYLQLARNEVRNDGNCETTMMRVILCHLVQVRPAFYLVHFCTLLIT